MPHSNLILILCAQQIDRAFILHFVHWKNMVRCMQLLIMHPLVFCYKKWSFGLVNVSQWGDNLCKDHGRVTLILLLQQFVSIYSRKRTGTLLWCYVFWQMHVHPWGGGWGGSTQTDVLRVWSCTSNIGVFRWHILTKKEGLSLTNSTKKGVFRWHTKKSRVFRWYTEKYGPFSAGAPS